MSDPAPPPAQVPVPTAMAFAVFDRLRARYFFVASPDAQKGLDVRNGIYLTTEERDLYNNACREISQFLKANRLDDDDEGESPGEKQGGAADA